jgi:hypothetical protein
MGAGNSCNETGRFAAGIVASAHRPVQGLGLLFVEGSRAHLLAITARVALVIG